MADTTSIDFKAQNEFSANAEGTEIVVVPAGEVEPVKAAVLPGVTEVATEADSPHATDSMAGDDVADDQEVGESGSEEQNSPTRRPFRRFWAAVMPRALLLAAGCTASLVTGAGLGYLAFGHSGVDSIPSIGSPVEEAGASLPARFIVATSRRNEPLKPLLPFDDLDQAVVDLGRRLFNEPGLSANGRVSCASCHSLDQGGTSRDALPRGVNGQTTKFNPPSVLNAALNFAYGWEGRFTSLEDQLDDPITRPDELGSSWERVLKFLDNNPSYRAEFIEAFDAEPSRESVAAALASYQRSLLTLNSRFDQWLAGDESALNSDEFGGYFLFKKYGCINCHQWAGVGGAMFQPLGFAKAYFKSPSDAAGLGRFAFTGLERDRHVFRVPSLRHVSSTAPYLHDGRAETLEEAVAVMLEFQCGEPVNREDVRRLTAFLKTLSGNLPDAL